MPALRFARLPSLLLALLAAPAAADLLVFEAHPTIPARDSGWR